MNMPMLKAEAAAAVPIRSARAEVVRLKPQNLLANLPLAGPA